MIALASGAMRRRRAFNSMPQFSDRDGGDFELLSLVCESSHAARSKASLLAADNDVGIEIIAIGLLAVLTLLRAALQVAMSRRTAFAFFGDRSTFAVPLPIRGPVQPFFVSGTRRATGVPFLSRTKVIF